MEHKIKILVAYHKPAKLLKSDIFVPIQVGRDVMIEKSKDGMLTSKDKEWLQNNLIGDNTGDNISKLNRYFNEMSAIYWAWKNQGELENPDFVGLMHYRRHFDFSESEHNQKTWLPNSTCYKFAKIDNKYLELLDKKYIDNLTEKYDIICSKEYDAKNLDPTLNNCKERFIQAASSKAIWYEKMEQAIVELHPEYIEEMKELQNSTSHYLCNMFVMRKDLFNEYCKFTFDVLFKVYEEFKNTQTDVMETRAIGYLAEYLTSIYISHYKHNTPDKVKELNLTYIEDPENTPIVKKIMNFIFSTKITQGVSTLHKVITIFGIKIRIKESCK